MSQSFILKASDDALALTGFYQEIQTVRHLRHGAIKHL